MKLFGCFLMILSAAGVFLAIRKNTLDRMRLAKALADDLALLRCGICVYRRPLEQILQSDLGQGVTAEFWNSLETLLAQRKGTVRCCWERTAETLPPSLDAILFPLGALLPAGGESFERAVNEAREKLLSCIRKQEEEQPVKLRLTAAVCFSAAMLIILVCV